MTNKSFFQQWRGFTTSAREATYYRKKYKKAKKEATESYEEVINFDLSKELNIPTELYYYREFRNKCSDTVSQFDDSGGQIALKNKVNEFKKKMKEANADSLCRKMQPTYSETTFTTKFYSLAVYVEYLTSHKRNYNKYREISREKYSEIEKLNLSELNLSSEEKNKIFELAIKSKSKTVMKGLFELFPDIISECQEEIDIFRILRSLNKDVFKLLVEKGGLETFQELFCKKNIIAKILHENNKSKEAAKYLDKLHSAGILHELLNNWFHDEREDKESVLTICNKILNHQDFSDPQFRPAKKIVEHFLDMYKDNLNELSDFDIDQRPSFLLDSDILNTAFCQEKDNEEDQYLDENNRENHSDLNEFTNSMNFLDLLDEEENDILYTLFDNENCESQFLDSILNKSSDESTAPNSENNDNEQSYLAADYNMFLKHEFAG